MSACNRLRLLPRYAKPCCLTRRGSNQTGSAVSSRPRLGLLWNTDQRTGQGSRAKSRPTLASRSLPPSACDLPLRGERRPSGQGAVRIGARRSGCARGLALPWQSFRRAEVEPWMRPSGRSGRIRRGHCRTSRPAPRRSPRHPPRAGAQGSGRRILDSPITVRDEPGDAPDIPRPQRQLHAQRTGGLPNDHSAGADIDDKRHRSQNGASTFSGSVHLLVGWGRGWGIDPRSRKDPLGVGRVFS